MDVKRKDYSGLYHNDYSPRYKEAYNIYDKARDHMKKLKKEGRDSKKSDPEEE